MIQISAEQIESNNRFSELVDQLKAGFQSTIETPMRHHHDFKNPKEGQDSTLLLMPSWEAGENLGVKIVTVSPENGKYNLPSIQGIYLLFDAHKGTQKAMLDGKALTVKRTAAASALASSYLSNKDSSSLLMIGTGALAPNLIRAHISQRPIKKVWVWGRNIDKAKEVIASLADLKIELTPIDDLDSHIPLADIISCATLSPSPLINGALLRKGQHIDLVGSYKKTTREADNEVISRSTIFVDTYQGALKESGDILIPLNEGLITIDDVKADLFSLTKRLHNGRTSKDEITVFKSVGHASEDLIAANYYFNKLAIGYHPITTVQDYRH